ncbi:MAG: heavy metal-associated domain-containing protein [Thermodesulfobacteriota bacterium]
MENIKIAGMSCGHCSASVTKALSALPGLSEVAVDLDKGEATFKNDGSVERQTIRQAISKTGFEPGD